MLLRISFLGLLFAYNKDISLIKLNLGAGVYRTKEGKPLVLNIMRRAEQLLVSDSSRVKECLPISGLAEFSRSSTKLIFLVLTVRLSEKREQLLSRVCLVLVN